MLRLVAHGDGRAGVYECSSTSNKFTRSCESINLRANDSLANSIYFPSKYCWYAVHLEGWPHPVLNFKGSFIHNEDRFLHVPSSPSRWQICAVTVWC